MPKQAHAKRVRNNSQVINERSPVSGKNSTEDERDIRDARRALKETSKKGSVPWEQVKREVGI
jgi:hypothetical protein